MNKSKWLGRPYICLPANFYYNIDVEDYEFIIVDLYLYKEIVFIYVKFNKEYRNYKFNSLDGFYFWDGVNTKYEPKNKIPIDDIGFIEKAIDEKIITKKNRDKFLTK